MWLRVGMSGRMLEAGAEGALVSEAVWEAGGHDLVAYSTCVIYGMYLWS